MPKSEHRFGEGNLEGFDQSKVEMGGKIGFLEEYSTVPFGSTWNMPQNGRQASLYIFSSGSWQ